MLAFWPDIIRPILSDLGPKHIVEIGSEAGKTTRKLVDWAMANDAYVHSIDPAPLFDVEAVERGACGRLRCLRLTSLVGLPSIERSDIVLIDGDHNWYTVYNELKLIERLALESGHPMPLVLLHDVCWPYGRRDLYYDPGAIPEEHRRPFAKLGITVSSPRLVMEGGFNSKLCNAIQEGGPKNGVLTAVEDYLVETSLRFEWVVIPAVFGLGMLMPATLAETNEAVAKRVRAWAPTEIGQFINRLEMVRLATLTSA